MSQDRIERADREMAPWAGAKSRSLWNAIASPWRWRRRSAARRALQVALAEARAADAGDRALLAAAEATVTSARDRLRAVEDRLRGAEVAELEHRLALDLIREQVLVELGGLGGVGLGALGLRLAAVDQGAWTGRGSRRAAALDEIPADVLERWAAATPAEPPASPARLATLRRRYHELGRRQSAGDRGVRQLRTRLEGLETQERDLREAIATTRALIEELGTMVAEQFKTTFRNLEVAFDARFKQLFGGGYARLELTDPDDLSATGVEIVARPPGKKAQALAMLSGGERALTAVALLFAMLEVRPVPFCVLDEVDAALDEANIGRFADALRDLADPTQFIVITHNRGTIEAADALYGVTVGDDSVSRVISLRLDEATAIADRAGAVAS